MTTQPSLAKVVTAKPAARAKPAPAPPPTEIVMPPLPPPEEPIEGAAAEPEPEPQPEPAITPADIVPPTQEELTATGVQQQNVTPRGAMQPNDSDSTKTAPYQFTDADRAKALATASRNKLPKYNWETEPLDEGLAYLAELRAETERGGLVLQHRISENRQSHVKCIGCSNIIDIGAGKFAGSKSRNNFKTGLPETAYACSAKCFIIMQRDFRHSTYAEELAKG